MVVYTVYIKTLGVIPQALHPKIRSKLGGWLMRFRTIKDAEAYAIDIRTVGGVATVFLGPCEELEEK